MKLYILRHAIAVDRAAPGYDEDSQRPLTDKGRRKMREIAKGMRRLDIAIDRILTSPYVRARQTAQIVARAFGLKKERVYQTESLAPLGFPDQLVAEINQGFSGLENLMLVGHEPYLSELVGALTAGAPSAGIQLKKGGLCRLSVEVLNYDRCAMMDWLLTPAQLAAFGK